MKLTEGKDASAEKSSRAHELWTPGKFHIILTITDSIERYALVMMNTRDSLFEASDHQIARNRIWAMNSCAMHLVNEPGRAMIGLGIPMRVRTPEEAITADADQPQDIIRN